MSDELSGAFLQTFNLGLKSGLDVIEAVSAEVEVERDRLRLTITNVAEGSYTDEMCLDRI